MTNQPESRNPRAMTSADVVVVGGGLAGLTAAARAADDGASVVVLERGSDLGGRARSDTRDGFVFNQGGHALYAEAAGVQVLRRLGITPEGVNPPLAGIGVHAEGNGTLPVGPRSMLRTRLLSARGKLSFGKAYTALTKADPAAIADMPYGTWVDEQASDVKARQVMHALARLSTYANAPDLVSAGAVVGQLQAGMAGLLYLHGGWQRLVGQLADKVQRAGAVIRTGAEVTSIARTDTEGIDGSWRVEVNAGGGSDTLVAGAIVVAGLSPIVSARLLGLDETAFAHAGPPAEAAVLDLSLDAQPGERFALGIDVPTYFSVHGPPADMAPPGCASAVAMKYLPVGEITDMDIDRADLDAVVSAAGVRDVRDTRFLRRMTVTHGLPMAAQGGLAGRPAVEIPGLAGAHTAGDWVGADGLLADASLASGEAAGRAAAAAASPGGAATSATSTRARAGAAS